MSIAGAPFHRLSPSRPDASEAALWSAFAERPGRDTREAVFAFYARFAQGIARRHFVDRDRGDIELADLSQFAAAGLLEAIDHFDPARGVPFQAYARRRIAGSVLDGIARLSEWREQAVVRRNARRDRMASLLEERSADPLETLRALTIGLALGYMLEDAGFLSGDGEPATQDTAYDSLAWKETLRAMGQAVDSLPSRERLVILHHYESDLSFGQIGALLGITKGRVSQIHRAALALLRKRIGQGNMTLRTTG